MATKTPMFQVTPELVLAAGTYVKVSDKRVGKAFLGIDSEGNLTYVDRNGLVTAITLSAFASKYRAGYSTPAGEAQMAAKVTKAPQV